MTAVGFAAPCSTARPPAASTAERSRNSRRETSEASFVEGCMASPQLTVPGKEGTVSGTRSKSLLGNHRPGDGHLQKPGIGGNVRPGQHQIERLMEREPGELSPPRFGKPHVVIDSVLCADSGRDRL